MPLSHSWCTTSKQTTITDTKQIVSTSQPRRQLILPAAFVLLPSYWKRRPTSSQPHAAFVHHKLLFTFFPSKLLLEFTRRRQFCEGAPKSFHANMRNKTSQSFFFFLLLQRANNVLCVSIFQCLLKRGAKERHMLRAPRDHQRVEEHLPPRPDTRHRRHLPVLPRLWACGLRDTDVPVGSDVEWRPAQMCRRQEEAAACFKRFPGRKKERKRCKFFTLLFQLFH